VVERKLLDLSVGAAIAAAVMLTAPLFRPGGAVSTAVACGTVAAIFALGNQARRRTGWALVVPGLVSLVASGVVLVRGSRAEDPGSAAVLEVAALLLILIHATRWNPGWSMPVVAAVTVAAQVLWLLRYMPAGPWAEQLLACLFWSLGSAVALAFGLYPRWAAIRLHRTVTSEREAQQRQLERDLHDYVAHDLSGIIVQAQAARYAAAGDASALAAALQRIEDSGQRAMSSMDRALSLLRARGPAPGVRQHPGLDELPDLLHQFEDGFATPTSLVVHGNLSAVPREVAEVLYRTASEALTNIRRHAGPNVTAVTVTLDQHARSAGIVVADEVANPAQSPAPRSGGGTGLSRLKERVDALGGALEAGPTSQGWQVSVLVPYSGSADR